MLRNMVWGMVLLALAASAVAQVTVYTDRTQWDAAAGPMSFYEDFRGWTTDESFQTTPAFCQGFSLRQVGTNNFRNIVDTPPFLYTDNNGTNHASMFVEGMYYPISVGLTPDQPLTAWSADFVGTAGGEGLDLKIFFDDGTQSQINVVDVAPTAEAFWGFVVNPGLTATYLEFVARVPAPGQGGEGFGMDQVGGVFIPEPAVGLLGLLGVVLLRRR